ncbi:hypothetical protein [Streptomyces fulvorobeus]|uniref:Uncharacterized protein n=1 Tax=Streptomyces fulvorobeus TaxID=284028 RepID=A0A7J0CFP4_9ACTN|nr:hypothetical protein [Streptomyces fulvorobeus]NYE44759.1 hypothetical protein [Streptomyces fulvorobeus]GFN01320.1 hypothetical protein Sfulv_61300 [Streptomyces fulvorobeus]
MSTPEENPEIPGLEDALDRARAAHKEMAAALIENQEPELGQDLGWQPVWKRPRKPESKVAEKLQLHKQRRRFQDAGKRRLAARQSRRPRSRQSRIGNAAARRDARPLSRMRHSSAWLW